MFLNYVNIFSKISSPQTLEIQTHNKNKYVEYLAKIEIPPKNIIYLAPKIFNKIPESIISEKNESKFNKMIRSYIIENNNIDNLFKILK